MLYIQNNAMRSGLSRKHSSFPFIESFMAERFALVFNELNPSKYLGKARLMNRHCGLITYIFLVRSYQELQCMFYELQNVSRMFLMVLLLMQS